VSLGLASQVYLYLSHHAYENMTAMNADNSWVTISNYSNESMLYLILIATLFN
jgi:hypothetical protein